MKAEVRMGRVSSAIKDLGLFDALERVEERDRLVLICTVLIALEDGRFLNCFNNFHDRPYVLAEVLCRFANRKLRDLEIPSEEQGFLKFVANFCRKNQEAINRGWLFGFVVRINSAVRRAVTARQVRESEEFVKHLLYLVNG